MSEAKEEPLWQAKASPFFYFIFRNGSSIFFFSLFTSLLTAVAAFALDQQRILQILVILLIVYLSMRLAKKLFREVSDSRNVTYELYRDHICERKNSKDQNKSFPRLTISKSDSYCMFGYCSFEFQAKPEPVLFPGPKDDPRFFSAPVKFMHDLVFEREMPTGLGLFGLREKDALRFKEIVQTLEM